MAVATGDWVAFLDDDDLWHRDKLREVAAYVSQHADCSALNHSFYYFADSEDGRTSGFGATPDFVAKSLRECHEFALSRAPKNSFAYLDIRGESFQLLLQRNRGALSESVVRRELAISAGGFPPTASYAEDWLFFLNVSRLAEWHTLQQPLGFQRLHAFQSTGDWQNGISILAAKVAAWYTGRPAPERQDWKATVAALSKMATEYRPEVQAIFWGNLRAGRIRAACTTFHLAGLLLPRWRDRLYTMLPPQLTWRVERYILGMHK
jgi:hypothetical protein